jgi:hypothetical protein
VEPKALGQFEGGDTAHICVVFEVKIDAKEMFEQVLIGTRVERRAEAVQ